MAETAQESIEMEERQDVSTDVNDQKHEEPQTEIVHSPEAENKSKNEKQDERTDNLTDDTPNNTESLFWTFEKAPKWLKIPKPRICSGIIILVIIFIIGIIIVLPVQNSYPTPKSSSISLREFSEDRARIYLDYMTETIGIRNRTKPRELTKQYIFQQLLSIKSNSLYGDRITVGINNATASSVHPHNLKTNNIYLFVNFTKRRAADYILISGHYDTQPFTVGCNDDALSIAVIIELASIYSSLNINKLSEYHYDVLFVAVDGEEKGLFPGSRSVFWADTRPDAVNPFFTPPIIVYNLESTGKGRHLMYRSNSDWVIPEFLKCTPRPFAHSLPASLLEMVHITLGTDASVYAHHGHTMDLANLEDHWIYHTPLDNCKNNYIEGSLQLLGDNTDECLQYFLKMEKNTIPISGYKYINRYDPAIPSGSDIPKYEPNAASLQNNLLFYTILNNSGFSEDISAVSVYQCICGFIFLLISFQILYFHNRDDFGSSADQQRVVEEIYDERKFIAKSFGLTVANYLSIILVLPFVTFLIKSLRKSQGTNIACVQHSVGLHCNSTYFRGLEGIYLFTMIILVFLITYSFQFGIAKINEKRSKEFRFEWNRMELMVFLINNIFFSFSLVFITLIGQIRALTIGKKEYSLEMVIHFSYLTFWWSLNLIFGNIIVWILYYAKDPGFIHPKIIDCFSKIFDFLKKHRLTVINISYVLVYLFPVILSSEFCFTFLPILIGFENWVKIEIVAVLAALVISTLIMPFSSLLQRHILDIYKYTFAIFIAIFLISFILCCSLPGEKMASVSD